MPPKSPHSIDYANCVIDGVLEQIRVDTEDLDLELTEVWVCSIEPQQSKRLLDVLKKLGDDPVDLRHLKRVKKEGDKLHVIVASTELLSERDEIDSLLNTVDVIPVNIYTVEIPKYGPRTKGMAVEWSTSFWPMIWKGDPNMQYLNQVRLDIGKMRQIIRRLQQLSKRVEGDDPAVVTIMTDPETEEILSIGYDRRSEHLLKHSVMEAIGNVANNELDRRQTDPQSAHNYLCLDYHVYTTHEPCVMCSMALVHSRIGRLVYLKGNSQGGIKHNYGIHNRPYLNWKYESWRWLEEVDVGDANDLNI